MQRHLWLIPLVILLGLGAREVRAEDAFVQGHWRGTLIGSSGIEDVEVKLSVRGDQVRGEFVWLDFSAGDRINGTGAQRRTFVVTRGVKKDDMWIVGFEGKASKKQLYAAFKVGKTKDQLNGVVEGWKGGKDRVILVLSRVRPLSERAQRMVGTWKGSAVTITRLGLGTQYSKAAVTLVVRMSDARLSGEISIRHAGTAAMTVVLPEIREREGVVKFEYTDQLGGSVEFELTLTDGDGFLRGRSRGGLLKVESTIDLEKGRREDVEPTNVNPLDRLRESPLLGGQKEKPDPAEPVDPEQRARLVADLTRAPWRGTTSELSFGGPGTTHDVRVLDVSFTPKGDTVEARVRTRYVDPDSPQDAPVIKTAEATIPVGFHGPRDLRFSLESYVFKARLDAKGRVLTGRGEWSARYSPLPRSRGLTLERGVEVDLEPYRRTSGPLPRVDLPRPTLPGIGGAPPGPPAPPKDWKAPEEQQPDEKHRQGTRIEVSRVKPLLGTWVGTAWHEVKGKRNDIPVDVVLEYRDGRLFGLMVRPGILNWTRKDEWLDLRLEDVQDGTYTFAARRIAPWQLGDAEPDVVLHLDESGLLLGPVEGWIPVREGEPGYQLRLRPAPPATEAEKALVGTWRGRVPARIYKHQDYILRFELRRGRLIAYVPLQTHMLDLYATTPVRDLAVDGDQVSFNVPGGLGLDLEGDRAQYKLTLEDGLLKGTVKHAWQDYPVEFRRE